MSKDACQFPATVTATEYRAFFAAATVLAVAVRIAWLPVASSDTTFYLLPWFDFIVANGGYRALGSAFSDYTPFYTYLLVVAAWFDGLVPRLWLIKIIALPFDFFAAITMARIVGLFTERQEATVDNQAALAAYVSVLFAPTVVINGAVWGQSDIIYSSALLFSFLMLCKDRPLSGLIAFGFAASVKIQAVFFSPFILFLILRHRVGLRHLLAIPLVYAILALPAAIMGRPLPDLALIYLNQAQKWPSLSMGAPNLWIFVPDRFYGIGVVTGLLLAVIIGWSFASLSARFQRLDARSMLLSVTLCLAVMPFILPKMHDRYWFPAELFAIGLAFAFPRLIFVPILLQASALQTYGIFFFEPQGLQKSMLIYTAVLINTATIGGLALMYFRTLSLSNQRRSPTVSDPGIADTGAAGLANRANTELHPTSPPANGSTR